MERFVLVKRSQPESDNMWLWAAGLVIVGFVAAKMVERTKAKKRIGKKIKWAK